MCIFAFLQSPFIKLHILLRRPVPGKICFHRALDHIPPLGSLICEHPIRPLDSLYESRRIIVLIENSVFPVLNGIFESADGVGNGKCSVLHGNHLDETAGFKPAGNNQRIRPRVNLVRQSLIILQLSFAAFRLPLTDLL